MRILLLISTLSIFCACTPQPTIEACPISSPDKYVSVSFAESGIAAPNHAGQEAFNQHISKTGFSNRRKSQFGFLVKTREAGVNPMRDIECKSSRMNCELENASTCQSFTCSGKLPGKVHLNVIDSPTDQYFEFPSPYYVEWDGKNLKCRESQ